MRLERVNLTDLVEEIGRNCGTAAGRQVEFVVAPALAAEADAHLLRLALSNLLNNAWSSRAKAASEIEFGVTSGGEAACCQRRLESGMARRPPGLAKPSTWARCHATCAPKRAAAVTFFVRDNGRVRHGLLGKLFGAFQRLHSTRIRGYASGCDCAAIIHRTAARLAKAPSGGATSILRW